jgi:hypothetical protein
MAIAFSPELPRAIDCSCHRHGFFRQCLKHYRAENGITAPSTGITVGAHYDGMDVC